MRRPIHAKPEVTRIVIPAPSLSNAGGRSVCCRIYRAVYVAGIAVFLSGFAPQASGDVAPVEGRRFQEAVGLYEKGWAGDDEALQQALELLEDLMESSAASPEVRAYWGSAAIARARLAPNWRKRAWLERGAEALDAAVAEADGNVRVRLLRATTFAILPRLAGKTDVAEADFAWLLDKSASLNRRSSIRQEIYYHAGAFALRNRDPKAVAWLEEAERAGDLGGIRIEQIARMLQFARSTFPTGDQNKPDFKPRMDTNAH